MELIDKLSVKNSRKLLLLLLDGLGGVPFDGKTELEKARTPNLDLLAEKSVLGLTDPVASGITPGSGPAHLALFGYDPIKYEIGRGILEALGVGLDVTYKDIAVRGNFSTVDDKGLVVDRRAGRISTEENKRICSILQKNINKIEDVDVIIHPGKEHRFVVLFRGDELYPEVLETDPQKVGSLPIECWAVNKKSEKTARIVREFIKSAKVLLKTPANMVLLRGFAKYPTMPTMKERFKLSPACIATYPMYKGLARLVGMDILECGQTIRDELDTLKNNWNNFDFFYLHIKKIDSLGEDGDFDGKVRIIEEVDSIMPAVLLLEPDVIVITGDHSTPAILKSHSWHPNPLLLYSDFIISDAFKTFTERNCARGGLGRFPSLDVMSLMLANGLKLKKYGA
ncbi:2,3-bisphosphoglycerate-independent phosphoglycerate mutase [candidate division WOR-3 bacterium]|nr:2,3-bisphosphoglycerate-independent phosphoglycerate mutase [candidate division WOR-3 bacterium]